MLQKRETHGSSMTCSTFAFTVSRNFVAHGSLSATVISSAIWNTRRRTSLPSRSSTAAVSSFQGLMQVRLLPGLQSRYHKGPVSSTFRFPKFPSDSQNFSSLVTYAAPSKIKFFQSLHDRKPEGSSGCFLRSESTHRKVSATSSRSTSSSLSLTGHYTVRVILRNNCPKESVDSPLPENISSAECGMVMAIIGEFHSLQAYNILIV
jgi:hypothetical protein